MGKELLAVATPILSIAGTAIIAWLVTSRTARRNVDTTLEHQAEMKIAEFRQAWINDLRSALASFQALATTPGVDPSTDKKFYELGTKIELMMNPKDPHFPELQQLMYDYLAASGGSCCDKYSINPRFVEVSQAILKGEWERLKVDLRANA